MSVVPQDLRIALRQLRRSPGFTATAAITLALGIGATTAIFTVLNHVVLRPLPYEEAARLVYINTAMPGEGSDTNWGVSEAGYFHLLENNRAFEEVGAYGGAETGQELTIVDAEGGVRVSTAYVSATLLDVLRARPAIGRLIREEDDGWMGRGARGSPGVVVLGHDYWLREYGGDPGVIGSTLMLEGELGVEIVGVMEPDFHMPNHRADIWVPLGLHPSRPPDSFHGYRVIGRLAPGVTLNDAAADLARLDARLTEAIPAVYGERFMEESGFRTRVTPLRARVLGSLDEALWILFGSVGLVLLIAGANVANLFLVRSEGRRRDVAIRQALGVGRMGLARQVMSEGLLLSLIAGGIGVWLAEVSLRLFVVVIPSSAPRLDGISIGGTSLLAALIITVLAGTAFGLVQFMTSSTDLSALRDGGVGKTPSVSRRRVRGTLVVMQMALALVLLAAAGMMFRSFERLRAVDPGLDAADVLLVDLHPPATRHYLRPASVQQLYRDLQERVDALPGVAEVAVGDVPLTYEPVCLTAHVENPQLDRGQPAPCINQSLVAPGYFQTLAIPLQGREPAWAETGIPRRDAWTGGEVVVTRALAERLWPGENPIGRGIRLREAGPPYARVVGVTGDLYWDGLDRPPSEHIFGQLWYRGSTLVVRTQPGALEEVAAGVRSTIRELDPSVAVGSMRTMEDVIAASPSMARTSLILLLLGIGAGLGVLLSAVGIFGVLAYIVAQRRLEIGIRMAIGARASQVATRVVSDSLKLVVAGVTLGLLAAFVTSRLLRSFLFGVTPGDPVTLFVVTSILVVVALAAAWIPARRAARVDPMVVLRAE